MRLALAAAGAGSCPVSVPAIAGAAQASRQADTTRLLDIMAPIAGLSPVEDATLCHWVAVSLGGYGRTRTCGDAKVSKPEPEAACVSDF